MPELEARSPLGAGVNSEQLIGELKLRLVGASSYLLLQGDAGNRDFCQAVGQVLNSTLPEVGERKLSDRFVIDTLTPDEWVIETLLDSAALLRELSDQLDGIAAAITDVSDSRCKLIIEGPASVDLLASACSVDFHHSVFHIGKTVLTSFASLPVLVAKAGENRFEILVNRASTEYLWRWLNNAAGLIASDLRET